MPALPRHMDITLIALRIFGGLVLFMFSISMLSEIMKRLTGPRLKSLLEKTTSTPLGGMATGTLVTFLMQSSSVTVLLLLGLVNAGVMRLNQAVFVILGSEIGTTITAQIVAFKVTVLFFPLIIFGFALRSLLASRERFRDCGQAIFALGLVFLAMNIMAKGAEPLKDAPQVIEVIARFGDMPLYGILIGTLFTAVTSSSSATTGMVIAMSMEGVLQLSSGIALIIGANLGTCALELIAMVGTSISARRTGMAQLLINLIGTLLVYPLLAPFAAFIATTADDVARQIANAHTLFNLTVSVVLLPCTGVLIAALKRIVPGEDRIVPELSAGLDRRLLHVPSLALASAEKEVYTMIGITEEMLTLASRALLSREIPAGLKVKEYENTIDRICARLAEYLGQINTMQLSEQDRHTKRALVHSLTDIERIADLAENLVKYSERKEIVFSEAARKDLADIFANAASAYQAAVLAARRKRRILHTDGISMEEQFKILKEELRNNYYTRQASMGDSAALDAFYPAVLRDLERICSHSLNIVEHFNSR